MWGSVPGGGFRNHITCPSRQSQGSGYLPADSGLPLDDRSTVSRSEPEVELAQVAVICIARWCMACH
eukprot:4567969-Amphidinium_carterae.1